MTDWASLGPRETESYIAESRFYGAFCPKTAGLAVLATSLGDVPAAGGAFVCSHLRQRRRSFKDAG
jgi:hypothetical protein